MEKTKMQLIQEKRAEAYNMHLQGASYKEIADKLGYSYKSVNQVIRDMSMKVNAQPVDENNLRHVKDKRKRDIVYIDGKRYINEVDFIAGV